LDDISGVANIIGGFADKILFVSDLVLIVVDDDACELFEFAAFDESIFDELVPELDASVKRITGENKFSNLNGFSVLNFIVFFIKLKKKQKNEKKE
jgi:hypothetical protein